jgi:hypothetical protein
VFWCHIDSLPPSISYVLQALEVGKDRKIKEQCRKCKILLKCVNWEKPKNFPP